MDPLLKAITAGVGFSFVVALFWAAGSLAAQRRRDQATRAHIAYLSTQPVDEFNQDLFTWLDRQQGAA